VTFEAFNVVVVPFPFTDRSTTKRRSALVLSDAKVFNVLTSEISEYAEDWPIPFSVSSVSSVV